MRHKLYTTFDFILTAVFAVVIMPLLGMALLVTTPAFRAIQLMNKCRRSLTAMLGERK